MKSTRAGALAFVLLAGFGCSGGDAGEVGSQESTLVQHLADLAVFDPAAQRWYYDKNDNGTWESPPDTYSAVGAFGGTNDIALSGWGTDRNQSLSCNLNGGVIGVYRSTTRQFFIDVNDNGVWDGTASDREFNFMPAAAGYTDQPIIWSKKYSCGAYICCSGVIGYFRTPNAGGAGVWYIDSNNNGVWDGPGTDLQYTWGVTGNVAVPLPGYQGSRLAVFERATGKWLVDENQNGQWDGCAAGNADSCKVFGNPYTTPFAHPNVGFRGISDGTNRYVDLNGNGVWDAGDGAYTFGVASAQAVFF
jgi:hypothetical protein